MKKGRKNSSVVSRNKKVAETRGESWKKSLRLGKLDSQMNPSVLKMKRVSKNISQQEIAKELNLSQTGYGAIERGKRGTSQEMAKAISKIVAAPITKLFKKTDTGHMTVLK